MIYADHVTQAYGDGELVLQALISSGDFVYYQISKKFSSLHSLMQLISDIEDGHVSLKFLRSCASVSEMNDMFCVVFQSLTANGANILDTKMEQCARNMVDRVLPHDYFVELGL